MMLPELNSSETSDSRGVSPVIGVILMVAITVILAAVIGTFVLGLGNTVSDTTPQASVSMSDASVTYANGTDAFIMEHTGGDGLPLSEAKITIQNTDTNERAGTWESGGFESSDGLLLYLNGNPAGNSGEFTTGDRLVIEDDGGDDTEALSSGTTYKITIVHSDTGRQVASATVELQ